MQNLYSIFSSLKSAKISNHLFEKTNHEIYFEPKKKRKKKKSNWISNQNHRPSLAEKKGERVQLPSNSIVGRSRSSISRQSKFAVEFHVLEGPRFRIWCARQRGGGEGRGEAGSGRTKEAENITKVSAASQFARSKRGLVSGPRAGNKKGGPDEQIKLPSTAPCTRLSRVEGTHGAPFVQGIKGTPLFENRSRVSPRKIKIIYIYF